MTKSMAVRGQGGNGCDAEVDAIKVLNWTHCQCRIGRYLNAEMNGYRPRFEI